MVTVKPNWLEHRLGLSGLYEKYGRKAFPVHSTFFLGEMALFSFVILVTTGVYLALLYVPSNVTIPDGAIEVPEAYASVRLIESIPVANVFRNVHHWGAHLMIASIVLHACRVFFFGTYRRPRELNWVVGVILLGLTLAAGFLGYSLPYDSYSVTATAIGYGIATSIPWVGNVAADLFFGGRFPTLSSIPRLYTMHIFILPLAISALIGLHMLILVKQKHSQPGYARRLAEPGKILGVPLVPYQTLLALQLLLLLFGALFLISAFVPPHPVDVFGPPGPGSLDVKPEWYLMWVYGFLKVLPAEFGFTILGGKFSSEFFGGIIFPTVIFGIMAFAPWLDRTNRRLLGNVEYQEPPEQRPVRLASGTAFLTLLAMGFVAAYYDAMGLSLLMTQVLTLGVPVLAGLIAFAYAKRKMAGQPYFDPVAEPPA